jgi:RNA polymerase sigma-70 factor (ECF subfamily)
LLIKPALGILSLINKESIRMEKNKWDFQEIFDIFQPKINRYLIYLVGESEAEDLTQEVFMKVNKALSEFRGESKISTWLYKIATNTALDKLRSSSLKNDVHNCTLDLDLETGVEQVSDHNTWTGEKVPQVEHQVFRKEMNDCIQGFINSLPNDDRTVLLLSEFEGFKDSEIAGILCVSIGTVKIRLHRAREKLKRKFVQNCDPYWIEENEFLPELKIV